MEARGAGGGRSPGPVRRRQALELRSRLRINGGRQRRRVSSALGPAAARAGARSRAGAGPQRSAARRRRGQGSGTGTMGGGGPRRPGALPLLALLALLAAQGGAAPLQPGGSPALTKIYPRGSHWAVGKSPCRPPRSAGRSGGSVLPACRRRRVSFPAPSRERRAGCGCAGHPTSRHGKSKLSASSLTTCFTILIRCCSLFPAKCLVISLRFVATSPLPV